VVWAEEPTLIDLAQSTSLLSGVHLYLKAIESSLRLWRWDFDCDCLSAHLVTQDPYRRGVTDLMALELRECVAHMKIGYRRAKRRFAITQAELGRHRILRTDVDVCIDQTPELQEDGFLRASIQVRRPLSKSLQLSDLSVADINYRMAQVTDEAFVVQCFAEALSLGTHPIDADGLGSFQFENAAHEIWGLLLKKGLPVVIAEYGTELVGHSSALFRRVDPLEGLAHTRLLDTFVIPKYSNQGIARFLTSAIVELGILSNDPWIVGTVSCIPPTDADRIIRELAQSGWEAWQSSWLRPACT
jgi:hypothetical protein